MRKFFFVAGVIAGLMLLNSGIARADCAPVEVSGAYNYYRLTTGVTMTTEPSGTGSGTGSSTTANQGFNLNGWNAEAQANISCGLGVVADFTALYGTPSIAGTKTNATAYNTFFGPRFSFRNGSPLTPFIESFLGVSHLNLASTNPSCNLLVPFNFTPLVRSNARHSAGEPVIIESSETCAAVNTPQDAFGGSFGGGVDITITPHLAFRVRGDAVVNTFNNGTQTNGSFSGGFVLRLGGGG